MGAAIVTAVEGPVGIIELNRPDKFNSLTTAAHDAIIEACAAFESNTSLRAILIRTAGDNFCTGADLQEVTEILADDAALNHFLTRGHEAMSRLETSPLPIVAAVQGLCLAGGLELMLAADVCFAGRTARLGDQHAKFGLIPGWGGSQRLPRAIGMRRALDLMMSGRWIGADEALQVGLVNYVVPDESLRAEAMAYCQALAGRSRGGLAVMKRLSRDGAELGLSDALRLECQAAGVHLKGGDVAEGIAAFRERRKPVFR
jgi:enoyl-CoA hydratase/carnithine racemase